MASKSRRWLNFKLRKIGKELKGDILNVSSGWDSDKEGGLYKDYFPNASSYSVSNQTKKRENDLILDLEKPLNKMLEKRFDVVVSITVLEHVFDCIRAFEILCRLSKKTVIIAVPFFHSYHRTSTFDDYWRFSKNCVFKLFKRNKFKVKYTAANKRLTIAVGERIKKGVN